MSNLKNIKTILVDDELNNINFLQALIKENCSSLAIIETASNANDGLLMIQELQPHWFLWILICQA
jgi:two-component system, LytTR family, response regulator